MFTTLPLELFVCREVIRFHRSRLGSSNNSFPSPGFLSRSLKIISSPTKPSTPSDISSSPHQSYLPPCLVRAYLKSPRASLTSAVHRFPVSLITCDLGVMLEITGGVSATALAFIFPAACYFKLLGTQTPWYHRSKLPAVCCVLFGVVVMTISLILAIAKTWTSEGDAKLCM